MTEPRNATDRDHRDRPVGSGQLAALVGLLVIVVLVAFTPVGWDFLYPRFAEIATAAARVAIWIYRAVIEPIVTAVFA